MQTLFTVGYQGHSIVTFLELLLAHAAPCALLCSEGPVETCHRLAVAEALERRAGGDLRVAHL